MKSNDKLINDILATQDAQLSKLHEIIKDAIREEELISTNLKYPVKETLTKGQEISDRVARFGGSWMFIILFMVVLAIWILYNAVTPRPFDPYPFILMNLVLSCIAALQAPVIMMSQNRQEEKDRERAENDYLINLKAEIEVRNLHQKMNLLMEEQFKALMESQTKQLKLLETISNKIGTK